VGRLDRATAHGLWRAKVPRVVRRRRGQRRGCASDHALRAGADPLNAKRPIDRATAAALHPELVRRAEAEWATLDDADSPDNATGDTGGTGGDGAAVLDELDRLDPELDIAEVDALLIVEGGEA